MKLNILGSQWKVVTKNYSDDDVFERRSICGYCDPYQRLIVVCNMQTYAGWEHEEPEAITICQKQTLRHEIVHAYFFESGLGDSSLMCDNIPWAKNEEMVDWIAKQGQKIYETWQTAKCLE